MSVHDNKNNQEEEEGSVLAEAMARGQAVQIMRKPSKKKDSSKGTSLMGFFGVEEEDDAEQEVVTADPASLRNMRRIAREKQKQALTTDDVTKKRRSPRRGVRRSMTFDGTSHRRTPLDSQTQPRRALSPNRMSVAAYRAPESNKRTLTRARTTSGDRSIPLSPFVMPTAASYTAEQRASDASTSSNRSKAYSEHEETIKRLTIHDDDIQKILQDPQAFARLQKVLRKHGAVTNEVLKQVLPLYVKHQLNSQAAKDAERKKRDEEEEEKLCVATPGVAISHQQHRVVGREE